MDLVKQVEERLANAIHQLQREMQAAGEIMPDFRMVVGWNGATVEIAPLPGGNPPKAKNEQ